MTARLEKDEEIKKGVGIKKGGEFKKIPALPIGLRKRIPLWELYKLCRKALKLEKTRLTIIQKVKLHTRPTLRLYQLAEKAAKKARGNIKKAQAIYTRLPAPKKISPWVSSLREANIKVDEAIRNIRIKTGLLVGEVDPSMQKNKKLEPYFDAIVNEEYGELEKKWVDDYEYKWTNPYQLDHFRSRAVDHWLISETASLLADHLAMTNLQRNQIIRAVLKVGVDQPFEMETIDTVLYREQKRRQQFQS
jgi:hypothetical protein